jgi:hypothetical protein
MLRNSLRAVLAPMLLALALPAGADIFHQGFFSLSADAANGRYRLLGDVPAAVVERGELRLPEGCRAVDTQRYREESRAMLSYLFDCPAGLAATAQIRLPFVLDGVIFDVLLNGERTRQVLPANRLGVTLPLHAALPLERPWYRIAAQYFDQGLRHIWMGWDHLVFVFCLCLLAGRGAFLLAAVTAFTLGHSLSMALAFLDIVALPIAPVEALIALSILFVARDAWLRPARPDASSSYSLLLVVAGFGLIHGLGFASALGELGVAGNETLPALAFFNLGVEAGQLLFVTAVFALRHLLQTAPWRPLAERSLLLGVGSMGSYWMVERIAGFPWGQA